MASDWFWSKVDRSAGPNACWPWIAARNDDGYGQAVVEGATQRAHRLSWSYENGPIPDGLFVLHRCDNPPCVNPAHLFLGTHADNHADMVAKGRGRGTFANGEAHPLAKLTASDVREVRALAAAGFTNAEIARRFNMSPTPIAYIVKGKTWRHVA